jgi:hypothetical protein
VPFAAARHLAKLAASDADVASMFEVSTQIAAWRMNATGARIIAERARKYGRRHTRASAGS